MVGTRKEGENWRLREFIEGIWNQDFMGGRVTAHLSFSHSYRKVTNPQHLGVMKSRV